MSFVLFLLLFSPSVQSLVLKASNADDLALRTESGFGCVSLINRTLGCLEFLEVDVTEALRFTSLCVTGDGEGCDVTVFREHNLNRVLSDSLQEVFDDDIGESTLSLYLGLGLWLGSRSG